MSALFPLDYPSYVCEGDRPPNDYYGVLLKKYRSKMFVDEHSMWPYLLSSKILRSIEKLSVGKNRKNVWKFRFILAMLVQRKLGKLPPLTNESSQQKYAEAALLKIRDPQIFSSLLLAAEQQLAEAIESQGASFDIRNAHQDRRFVSSL